MTEQLAVWPEVPGHQAARHEQEEPGQQAARPEGPEQLAARQWLAKRVTGCATMASEEDSCPVDVACPTLTVGEVGGVSSILEMDS